VLPTAVAQSMVDRGDCDFMAELNKWDMTCDLKSILSLIVSTALTI
jgi:hypothetical protein